MGIRITMKVKRILFACVHNSGRSQMTEAFARQSLPDAVEVKSAGTNPGNEVNPLVVKVMKEKGIDISDKRPKLLNEDMVEQTGRVITMGCSIEDQCPAIQIPSEDWGIDDPAGKTIEKIRDIRDQIEVKVRVLLSK
jgi:arsenate reductase